MNKNKIIISKDLTFYDNFYNKLNSVIDTDNRDDLSTPIQCIKVMLDYVPEELWKRKFLKVLDPCCGNGNFGAVAQFKTNMDNIYFNELNTNRFLKTKKILNPKNISNLDAFQLFKNKEKYDLIMANPPYSGGKNKNKSISKKFIEGSIDILNEDGYLCFITPNNWMSFNNNNLTLKRLLNEGQFIVIDNDAKKFFPRVGSSFTIFVWKKTSKILKTYVKNNYLIKDTQKVTIPNNIPFLPLYLSSEIISIVMKSFLQERNIFNYRCDLHNWTKKKCLSDEKDRIFKYPTIHTARKTRYATFKQDIYNKWLIIFPLSTYFVPYIENRKNVTQSVGYIEFDTKYKAKKFLEKLKTDYIKVLVHISRFGNFNNLKLFKHILFNEPKFDFKEKNTIQKLRNKIEY